MHLPLVARASSLPISPTLAGARLQTTADDAEDARVNPVTTGAALGTAKFARGAEPLAALSSADRQRAALQRMLAAETERASLEAAPKYMQMLSRSLTIFYDSVPITGRHSSSPAMTTSQMWPSSPVASASRGKSLRHLGPLWHLGHTTPSGRLAPPPESHSPQQPTHTYLARRAQTERPSTSPTRPAGIEKTSARSIRVRCAAGYEWVLQKEGCLGIRPEFIERASQWVRGVFADLSAPTTCGWYVGLHMPFPF